MASKAADPYLAKGYIPQWALNHRIAPGPNNRKPHMPCYQLCSYVNRPSKMWRPHLSCLVCPPRRYFYAKTNDYICIRKIDWRRTGYYIIAAAPGTGSWEWGNRNIYSLMVNCRGKGAKLRDATCHTILRMVERVNNWMTSPRGKHRKVAFFAMEAPPHGALLLKQYKGYFLVLCQDIKYRKLRNFLIKPWLTVCELIAQW